VPYFAFKGVVMNQGQKFINDIQSWGLEPEGYYQKFEFPLVSNTFLYFFCDEGAQYLKIGISKNPRWRIKELQTGNPLKLIHLLSFYATQENEFKLHNILKEHCLIGEWYPLTKCEVQGILKDLCLGYFCGMDMPIFNQVYGRLFFKGKTK
jgi:hypothetical protein